jgi:hypothetical protein
MMGVDVWSEKVQACILFAKKAGVRLEAGFNARVHARKADLALDLGEPAAEVAKHLDRAALALGADPTGRAALLAQEFQAEALRLAVSRA